MIRRTDPADLIVALNIGIYETIDGYCLYLTGSRYFDEGNDGWACDADYRPNHCFLIVPNNNQKKDWILFLNEVKKVLLGIFHSKEADISKMSGCYITVGFDDGDLEVIYRPCKN